MNTLTFKPQKTTYLLCMQRRSLKRYREAYKYFHQEGNLQISYSKKFRCYMGALSDSFVSDAFDKSGGFSVCLLSQPVVSDSGIPWTVTR